MSLSLNDQRPAGFGGRRGENKALVDYGVHWIKKRGGGQAKYRNHDHGSETLKKKTGAGRISQGIKEAKRFHKGKREKRRQMTGIVTVIFTRRIVEKE